MQKSHPYAMATLDVHPPKRHAPFVRTPLSFVCPRLVTYLQTQVACQKNGKRASTEATNKPAGRLGSATTNRHAVP